MRFWKIIAAVASFVGGVAHAEPYFASKDGSMIWDKETELVWMRCSLGQKWSGDKCDGAAESYAPEQAKEVVGRINAAREIGGVNDWVIPTVRQLVSLRFCSNGNPLGEVNVGGAPLISRECPANVLAPTLNPVAFPKTKSGLYLSDSVSEGLVWHVSFKSGVVYQYRGPDGGSLRLVRTKKIVASEVAAAVDFPILLEDPFAAQRRQQAEERIRIATEERQRAIDERRREEERKRKAAEEAAAERASLQEAIAKGAQQLYLLAGQAQRGKDVQIRSRQFGAVELYELIVEHFPKSDFAVKATDQLTAISRNESLSRAASEGQNRAQQQMENQRENQRAASRQQCEAQKQTCFSGCGQSSYWNGRSYVDNQSWSGCRSRCESISCY